MYFSLSYAKLSAGAGGCGLLKGNLAMCLLNPHKTNPKEIMKGLQDALLTKIYDLTMTH